MDPSAIALFSIVGTLGALALFLVVISGFRFGRLGLAIQAFNKTLREDSVAEIVANNFRLPPPPPPPAPKPNAAPVRALALLQREGRLLDFLLEDIQACDDGQIGAAVRDIHRKCRKVLQDHVDVEPILLGNEGADVDVPVGFNPAAVRLTGNVTGQPPFRGALIHPGWRVLRIRLPEPAEGHDEFILQPAEVHLP